MRNFEFSREFESLQAVKSEFTGTFLLNSLENLKADRGLCSREVVIIRGFGMGKVVDKWAICGK